jgi:outer membrane receptor protein involved in Fe transport
MGAAYLAARREINPCWTAELALGYAERPPALTELYAAETFMFVLQNGLNTVTGDPLLRHERLLQADAGLNFDTGPFRGRVGGFYAWAWDYITFENLGVVRGPPYGEVEQVQLKFVTTDLATFAGAEAIGEWDCRPWLTPFATLSYVAGTDRTRNGDAATRKAEPGSPSNRIAGLPRGAFSGIPGDAEEPLPGIVPLESRLGLRFHEPAETPRWSVELAARIVDAQRRIAASLLEVPSAGFTVWDVRGYWRATDRLLVLAGIENFTDKNYREHLNFTSQNGLVQVFQPGLNGYLGARLEY